MLNLEQYLERQNAFTKAATKSLIEKYSEDGLLYIDRDNFLSWMKEQKYSSKRTAIALLEFVNGFKKQAGKQILNISDEECSQCLLLINYSEAMNMLNNAIDKCNNLNDELMLKLILNGFDIDTIVSLKKSSVTDSGLFFPHKGKQINYENKEIAEIANKLTENTTEEEYLYTFAIGVVKRNASMSTRLKRAYSIDRAREVINLMRLKELQKFSPELDIEEIVNSVQGQESMALYGLDRRSLRHLIENYKDRL